ncbi:MAG: beta-galactosidase, partial [Anaerolineales bacterium]
MRVFEFRLTDAAQRLTDEWKHVPVAPRREALLGISFRPLQAEAFGLDLPATLKMLLQYPFDLIRLGAYWNRMEPKDGAFLPDELDRQIEAAEEAGKKIIVCLGPVKTFGYPEFFVPAHHLSRPFREGTRIRPADHPALLDAAIAHIARLAERYGKHESIVAWQLEHEAVDPLGVEHLWRLD